MIRDGGTVVNGKIVDMGDGVLRKGAKYPMPEGGMYATAADMARFYQMALNGGTLDGKRILSRAAMDVMTALHTASIDPAGHSPGMGYGLTWAVSRDSASTLTLSSIGSYGHGGAFGTQGFIDPAKKLIGVFLIQRYPAGPAIEANVFREIANAAIE